MPSVKVVKFTRIKGWLIPADKSSYLLLHKLRVPNVRFTEDFIPTLQLLLRKHKITMEAVEFADILNDFMSKFVRGWEDNPKRRVFMSKGLLRLESRDLEAVTRSFPAAETCLRKFFRRWGFECNAEFSQSPTRAKLVFKFELSKTKQPIIEFRPD